MMDVYSFVYRVFDSDWWHLHALCECVTQTYEICIQCVSVSLILIKFAHSVWVCDSDWWHLHTLCEVFDSDLWNFAVYRVYATLYFIFVVDGSESELGIRKSESESESESESVDVMYACRYAANFHICIPNMLQLLIYAYRYAATAYVCMPNMLQLPMYVCQTCCNC